MVKEQKRRNILVNAIGAVAYFCLLLVWMLFIGVIILFVTENQVPESVPTSPAELPSFLVAAVAPIGLGVAALMILVMVFVVVTFPYLVGKFGSRALRSVLSFMEIGVTGRSLLFGKLVAIVLPVIGFFVLSVFFKSYDSMLRLVALSAYMAAAVSVLLFALQHLLGRRLSIGIDRLW